MSLRHQVLTNAAPASRPSRPAPPASTATTALRTETATLPGTGLKIRFHQKIIERVDLEKLYRMAPEQVRTEIARLIDSLISEDSAIVNDAERQQLVNDVFDEMFGLGPLEPLLQDPSISDILVNTCHGSRNGDVRG